MKKLIKYLLPLTLIVLSSCEKVIDMNIGDRPPKLVLNALIAPDSVFYAHVSQSIHILDDAEVKYINSATVVVFENDLAIDTLKHREGGYYISENGKKPKVGQKYTYEVSNSGFALISGNDVLPQPVEIKNIRTEKKEGEIDPSDPVFIGSEIINLKFVISDPAQTENFYLMRINKNYTDTYTIEPGYWYPNYVFMKTESPLIEIYNDWGNSMFSDFNDVAENTINIGGDKTIEGNIFGFSDKSFNGKETTLEVNFYDSGIESYYDYKKDSSYLRDYTLEMELFNISKAYYLYIRSLGYNSGDPFTEPQQVYTNIQNGYGVFLAKSSNKAIIPMPAK